MTSWFAKREDGSWFADWATDLFLEKPVRFFGPWPSSGEMTAGACGLLPNASSLSTDGHSGTNGIWATPTACVLNDSEGVDTFEARRKELKLRWNNGNGMGTPLTMQVKSWPTPIGHDGAGPGGFSENDGIRRGGGNAPSLSHAVGSWATPRANGLNHTSERAMLPGRNSSKPGLEQQAAGWPTPTCQDGANNGPPSAYRRNNLPLHALVTIWPTPQTVEHTSKKAQTGRPTSGASRGGASFGLGDVADDVARNLWPTPRASENENRSTGRSPSHVAGTHGKNLAAESCEWAGPDNGTSTVDPAKAEMSLLSFLFDTPD